MSFHIHFYKRKVSMLIAAALCISALAGCTVSKEKDVVSNGRGEKVASGIADGHTVVSFLETF